MHGAAWWTTFRRILLALAWPSFAVGWILIFFVILRELSASILLYSVGNEVAAGRGHADVDGGQGRPGERDRAGHARPRVPVPLRRATTRANPSRAGRDRPPPRRRPMLTRRTLLRLAALAPPPLPRRSAAQSDDGGRRSSRPRKRKARSSSTTARVGTPAPAEGRRRLRGEVRHPLRAAGGASQRAARAHPDRAGRRQGARRRLAQRLDDHRAAGGRGHVPALRRAAERRAPGGAVQGGRHPGADLRDPLRPPRQHRHGEARRGAQELEGRPGPAVEGQDPVRRHAGAGRRGRLLHGHHAALRQGVPRQARRAAAPHEPRSARQLSAHRARRVSALSPRSRCPTASS